MQAARGASLTGDQDVSPPPRPRGARTRLLVVFGLVALAAYAVDVISKVVAVDRLTGRPDVEVLGDLLVLHLVRNPGAAFSTGTAYTELFTVLAIVAVGAILWFVRRVGSAVWAVALGLLLAGVAGNLTDRLVRQPGPPSRHVIDFFMPPHWPGLNVADMCINVAAALILVQVVRGVHVDGSRTSERGEPS